MAVDFLKLPPEEPVPDKPPSRFVWTIVFFVIVIAAIFAVLLLWPNGEPTRTVWFWTCLTVYPLGVAAFVVSRRYSVYEGRRLDAIAWNGARKQYVDGVFELASRPLAILAATYRFSNEAKEDCFDKLLDGTVKLEPRIAPKPDAPPVNARWFEKPDANDDGKQFEKDDERRGHLLSWAFSAVLVDVAETVRRLPPDLKLAVYLMPFGIVSAAEVTTAWKTQWNRFDLRPLQPKVLREPADLMSLDAWLDRVNQNLDEEARLLVCVRLNHVHQALPPDGSTEAVVAILVTPEAIIRRFDLTPLALLHRPNGAEGCSVDVGLARALQWGRLEPAGAKRIWQCGLDAAVKSAVTAAVVKADIRAAPMNVDYMIGHAGEAAPWLGIACATKAAVFDGSAQLVATASKKGPYFSVVRNIDDSRARTAIPRNFA